MHGRSGSWGRPVVASLASLAVHGAVAALASTARLPEVHVARPGGDSIVELAFVAEEAGLPLPVTEARESVEARTAPPKPWEPRPSRAEPRLPVEAAEAPAVGEIVAAPPPPDVPAPRLSPHARLDARSAALGALGYGSVGELRAPGADRPGVPSEEQLESALDAHLRAAVVRRDELARRPPPSLRRRGDGSYAYRGPAFEAVIDREGTVHFSDRSGRSYDGWRAGEAEQDARAAGLRMRFDATQRAEARHGNDIWAAERDWFLAETEVLRDRLAAEARAGEGARVRRAVRTALEGILNDASLAPAERRRRIFLLWDDCADDASGQAARGVIESFVRERLPVSGPHGYGEAELRALNAERPPGRGFEPYASSAPP